MTTPLIGRKSIQGLAIRLWREADDGTPVSYNSTAGYANTSFVKLDIKPAIEAANQFTTKDASGSIDINYRDLDKVKWWELTLEITYPDPALMELLLNGELLMNGADILGFAYPNLAELTDPNPVSLEVWTRNIYNNTQLSDFPFQRYLAPFCKFRPDDNTFANAPQTFSYQGYAMENENYGNGPRNDWTSDETGAGDALDSTRALAWIYSTHLPDQLAPGYIVI
jgi:hypothetical protein